MVHTSPELVRELRRAVGELIDCLPPNRKAPKRLMQQDWWLRYTSPTDAAKRYLTTFIRRTGRKRAPRAEELAFIAGFLKGCDWMDYQHTIGQSPYQEDMVYWQQLMTIEPFDPDPHHAITTLRNVFGSMGEDCHCGNCSRARREAVERTKADDPPFQCEYCGFEGVPAYVECACYDYSCAGVNGGGRGSGCFHGCMTCPVCNEGETSAGEVLLPLYEAVYGAGGVGERPQPSSREADLRLAKVQLGRVILEDSRRKYWGSTARKLRKVTIRRVLRALKALG